MRTWIVLLAVFTATAAAGAAPENPERRHAWELAAQAAPAFESWRGEGDLFGTAVDLPRGIRGFSRAGVAGADGDPESPGAPVLAYTLYNEAAFAHIRRYRLNEVAILERLRDGRTPAVPAFPTDAVIVKTVWWPVAREGATALPVWDPADNPPRRNGNPYTTWTRVVAVGGADTTAAVDFAGRSVVAPRIDIDAFHHVTVDAALAARIMEDGEAHKAVLIALGRPLEAGDILLLVGLNLASRETPEWTWAALWWHDRAADSDRPRDLGAPWTHYAMQVAYDPDLPAAADGGPHIAFNPWLEGRFPDGGRGGGVSSNCMACHLRASYPPSPFLPVSRGRTAATRDSALGPDRLRTSLIWSLAMHGRQP